MSTLDMNLLILSVFSTCVKIPASAKIMIEHVGVLSWLCSIISTVEFYHFDIIEGLISIINNLWYSLKATENDFHNFAHLNLEIHRLILSLLPHLSPRISTTHFAKLMNIFNKTSNCDMSLHSSLSSDQLERLIGCTGKHYPEELAELESIKAYGGAGTLSQEEYCKYLHEQQKLNADAIVCLSSLRSYIKQWWEIKHKDAEIDSNCMEDLNETKDYAVVLM